MKKKKKQMTILTLHVPLAAVHVYGRIASLVTGVRVVEQQPVRAQLFREFTVGGTMIV